MKIREIEIEDKTMEKRAIRSRMSVRKSLHSIV